MMEKNMNKTKKCEYCNKDINIHIRVCPFCGGEVRDILEKELLPLCPRCLISLESHTRDGENYNRCPRCSGIWLDHEEFHQATKESDIYRDEDTHKKYFRGPVTDPVEYIPCVRCGKLMNRKNFAHISGVIIDECRSHGVWLDAGELEKIRVFIVDGGLEKAQDKRIEGIASELRDLANQADQTAFMMRLLHFWKAKRWLFGG
jgi:Zn-finger nucleic acid-binding protein